MVSGRSVSLQDADLEDLRRARALLETPGLAARVASMGMPIGKGLALLPAGVRKRITVISRDALGRALDTALGTLRDVPNQPASTRTHKLMVATSGGFGGFFGLAALAVELPVSTTLIMRAIADIARSEGESLATPEARLACLEVFALGGRPRSDDDAEVGYLAVRAAMAQSLTQASQFLAANGLFAEGAPMLVNVVAQVAQRFSVQVSEKVALQALPVVGAVGGAVVNTVFMHHFQDMARGHFTLRRLERRYGQAAVEAAYRELGRVQVVR